MYAVISGRQPIYHFRVSFLCYSVDHPLSSQFLDDGPGRAKDLVGDGRMEHETEYETERSRELRHVSNNVSNKVATSCLKRMIFEERSDGITYSEPRKARYGQTLSLLFPASCLRLPDV